MKSPKTHLSYEEQIEETAKAIARNVLLRIKERKDITENDIKNLLLLKSEIYTVAQNRVDRLNIVHSRAFKSVGLEMTIIKPLDIDEI